MTKYTITYFTAVLLFASTFAVAQPINYQGKLTDKSGNPISGNKDVSLKVYDAKTDGKLTYEEAIGPVTLTKGIYSFNFGEEASPLQPPQKQWAARMAKSRSSITPQPTSRL